MFEQRTVVMDTVQYSNYCTYISMSVWGINAKGRCAPILILLFCNCLKATFYNCGKFILVNCFQSWILLSRWISIILLLLFANYDGEDASKVPTTKCSPRGSLDFFWAKFLFRPNVRLEHHQSVMFKDLDFFWRRDKVGVVSRLLKQIPLLTTVLYMYRRILHDGNLKSFPTLISLTLKMCCLSCTVLYCMHTYRATM